MYFEIILKKNPFCKEIVYLDWLRLLEHIINKFLSNSINILFKFVGMSQTIYHNEMQLISYCSVSLFNYKPFICLISISKMNITFSFLS